jgi:hypothetical protein
MTITMKHTGDTQRFAKYSSDDTDDAYKKGVPVVKAWIPFEAFPDAGFPPAEVEVNIGGI